MLLLYHYLCRLLLLEEHYRERGDKLAAMKSCSRALRMKSSEDEKECEKLKAQLDRLRKQNADREERLYQRLRDRTEQRQRVQWKLKMVERCFCSCGEAVTLVLPLLRGWHGGDLFFFCGMHP